MKLKIFIVFIFISCLSFYKKKYQILGIVEIYKEIPKTCNKIKGLKKEKVILSYSEKELIQNYGITNLIYFKDSQSPILYGSLYYMDFDNDIYCMALMNGMIAVIKKPNQNNNKMIQEICYPLTKCAIYDQNNFIYNLLKD
ncbi:MAG: hypothetical protein KatS3mg129_3045 [Leptospiraceae bacterium]|nr:MAG: hypothetical protein KatS3mg129_3045 [Leptospiraceae bacterium]